MNNTDNKETVEQSREIKTGDWIHSKNYGDAVCIGVEDEFIRLRYHAMRNSDKKEIWVENSEHKDYVKFLKLTDETAQYVLTLKGPYGEGVTKNKRKY